MKKFVKAFLFFSILLFTVVTVSEVGKQSTVHYEVSVETLGEFELKTEPVIDATILTDNEFLFSKKQKLLQPAFFSSYSFHLINEFFRPPSFA